MADYSLFDFMSGLAIGILTSALVVVILMAVGVVVIG